MSRDFGKNMPKHLAGYYLLNSYVYSFLQYPKKRLQYQQFYYTVLLLLYFVRTQYFRLSESWSHSGDNHSIFNDNTNCYRFKGRDAYVFKQ